MKYVNERTLFGILAFIFAMKAMIDAAVFIWLFEDALVSALCVYILIYKYKLYIKYKIEKFKEVK